MRAAVSGCGLLLSADCGCCGLLFSAGCGCWEQLCFHCTANIDCWAELCCFHCFLTAVVLIPLLSSESTKILLIKVLRLVVDDVVDLHVLLDLSFDE